MGKKRKKRKKKGQENKRKERRQGGGGGRRYNKKKERKKKEKRVAIKYLDKRNYCVGSIYRHGQVPRKLSHDNLSTTGHALILFVV